MVVQAGIGVASVLWGYACAYFFFTLYDIRFAHNPQENTVPMLKAFVWGMCAVNSILLTMALVKFITT
jgi:hypothetical protein